MELRDYLHYKRINLKDFASMCGYSRVHMHLVKINQVKPGAKMVRKIEDATNGEVTRYDLLKDHKEGIEKI